MSYTTTSLTWHCMTRNQGLPGSANEEKQDTVTVFSDNLAKAWITLKHLDTYPCCICSQENQEFFESGAIAQVNEDNVDDVNWI